MKNLKTALIITTAIISAGMAFSSFGCSDSKDDGGNNGTTPTSGFTYDDVITAYDAFNKYLFSNGRQVYRRDTHATSDIAVGWTQSMLFDMTMNAYKLTGDQKYLDLMQAHYEGCSVAFKFDWYDYNYWELYDDMMWWVGSFARAYMLTDNDEYLELSEEGFKRVWYGNPYAKDEYLHDATSSNLLDKQGSYAGDDSPGLDISKYGGMYWDWKFGRIGKMACINYPTIIAAMELYNATGKPDYLQKAKDVYIWAENNIFNAATGAVADSKHDGNNNANWQMLVYNQATCMGAAAMLYLETGEQKYLNHAIAAMDYIVREKSTANKILMPEGTTNQAEVANEQGIYNAILAQYLPILINDCGQTQYIEFIERSIEYGWKNRDKTRNLCNKLLEKAPTTGALSVYTASGVPALMLTFPDVKNRK